MSSQSNRNYPNFTILDNWIFENFILADEPFAKSLHIFRTRAAHWGVVYEVWPNWLCLGKGGELKNWMLEQLVNNKGCSSTQFFLRVFYQGKKKDLSFIKLFWDKKVPYPKWRWVGREGGADVSLVFLAWSQKVIQVCIQHYLLKYGLLIKFLNHTR